MKTYAMVVVIATENADRAHDVVTSTVPRGWLAFAGEPWEVRPFEPAQRDVNIDGEQVDVEPVFDTLDCLEQHPERPR